MKRQNLRTLALVVVTFVYLLIGAALFGLFECDHEQWQRDRLEELEWALLQRYNISQSDYDVLSTAIITLVPQKAGTQWQFTGAFYFAFTVVTTIGE